MSRAAELLSRSRSSTLLSGAIAGLVLRIITAAATPIAISLAARSLSGRDFSQYATLLAAGTTVGLLCTFQMRELLSRAEDNELPAIWAVGGTTTAVMSAAALASLVIAALAGAAWTNIAALGLLMAAQPVESMSAGQLIRLADARRLGLIQSAVPILRLGGSLFLFFTDRPTIAQFLAVVALAQIVPSAIGIGRNGFGYLISTTSNIGKGGHVLRAGSALTMTLSGAIVVQRSDVVMVGLLSAENEAGDYLAVLQVLDVPWLLTGAILTLFIPSLRERAEAARQRLVGRLFVGLVTVMTAAAVIFAGVTPFATELLLGRPSTIDNVTIALAAGATVLATVFMLLGQYAVMLRKDKATAAVSVTGAIGNLVLNFFLIRSFSTAGAAAATFLAYAFLVTAMSIVVFDGRSGIGPSNTGGSNTGPSDILLRTRRAAAAVASAGTVVGVSLIVLQIVVA